MRDLRQLRALIALGEESHFGRAAERFGMAQPHFSTLVRKIETDVGTPLFRRRPHVEPTPAGKALIEGVQRALDDLDRSWEEARRIGRGETGTVRVGFASTVMLTDIPQLLQEFRADYPLVRMELRELHSGAQARELHRGSIDISLTRESSFEPGVTCTRMVSEPFVSLLRKGHPLATAGESRLAALASEPLILFRRAAAPILHRQITALFEKAGLPLNVAQEADEWHTVLGLVAAGFGFSIAPESVCRLASEEVVCSKVGGVSERAHLFLCWMPDKLSPPAAKLIKVLEGSAKL